MRRCKQFISGLGLAVLLLILTTVFFLEGEATTSDSFASIPVTQPATAVVANTPIATVDLPTALPPATAVTPTAPLPTQTAVQVETLPVTAVGKTTSPFPTGTASDFILVSHKDTLPPSLPAAVNNISIEDILILPAGVQERACQIYAHGQTLGRNPHAFSKIGDSLIATPNFLTRFDTGSYDLGEYAFLQPTIDHFGGSFVRYGVAIRAGLHTWSVFDPMWADKEWCQPNEDMLTCELRLHNPSILLIQLGTNDGSSSFENNLRKIVELTIEKGVIPVLATKADRFDGPEDRNNAAIRRIAADFKVPLWDFDLVAATLPERGLREDEVHLTTFPAHDYTLPQAFEKGHAVHNLAALMMLDAIRKEIIEAGC